MKMGATVRGRSKYDLVFLVLILILFLSAIVVIIKDSRHQSDLKNSCIVECGVRQARIIESSCHCKFKKGWFDPILVNIERTAK